MKKYIIVALAAILALPACTITDIDVPWTREEISFEVARYAPQTRAEQGMVYSTSNEFGTYAWFSDDGFTTIQNFMDNERVGFVSPVWKTVDHTFYWPKTGALTFLSYSPFQATGGPAVTRSSIVFPTTVVDPDNPVDILYADPVTVLMDNDPKNTDEITDDLFVGTIDSGFKGVPTLFHHSLAKFTLRVQANFLEWGTPPDSTSWEVKLVSAEIGGLYTKGDLSLTWTSGAWNYPTNRVWSNPSDRMTTNVELLTAPIQLKTEKADTVRADYYVLPQTLLPASTTTNRQAMYLTFEIKTKLANGKELNETFFKAIDFVSLGLEHWKMNQNIVYTLKFKPTHIGDGSADTPEDVTINFDPAVSDWETSSIEINVQL